METISLKEAAAIVGKDESTIRKFFNKPENKEYRQVVKGKMYVSKDLLIRQYVGEKEATSARLGTPRNSAEHASELPNEQQSVSAAMQALISQLEAKDNQISDLLSRLHESNSNHARALQQHNPSTEPAQQTIEILREQSQQTTSVLADQIRRKEEEITELNRQLHQESQAMKKAGNMYIAVILVLAAVLVAVMLIG